MDTRGFSGSADSVGSQSGLWSGLCGTGADFGADSVGSLTRADSVGSRTGADSVGTRSRLCAEEDGAAEEESGVFGVG